MQAQPAAQHLLYAGATKLLLTPGPFTSKATVNSANGDNGTSELNVSQVKLTRFACRNAGCPGHVVLCGDCGRAGGRGAGRLSAPELKLSLELLTGEGHGGTSWMPILPIAAKADNAQQTVAFTAEHVRVEAAEDELSQIELSGNVVVDSAGSMMTAQLH